MTASLECLVKDWTAWLNGLLAHPSLPLHAQRSPNDAGNEDDASITRASVHLSSLNTSGVPAMVGLVCASEDHEHDSDILGYDVFEDQIRPLASNAPFFCFVAHGTSRITFYYCEFGSAGRDGSSVKIDVGARGRFERGGREQDTVLREVLMYDITANLAQIARAAMARPRGICS